MAKFNSNWHLAKTKEEEMVTEFEFILWRIFNSFLHWQEECEKSINDSDLTGYELAVLHIVRMKEKPKTISDIARLLNRSDMFNVQYSIKKLLKTGLIEKTKSTSGKTAAYQISEEGIKNTDAYTQAKKDILINLFTQETNLDLKEIIKILTKLKTIYDEANRLAVIYTPGDNSIEPEK